MRDVVECEAAIKHFKRDSSFIVVQQRMPDIKEAVKLLQIPYEVTQLLQRNDCTLSDFYGACIKMREKFKIAAQKNLKTDLAKQLLAEFGKRNGQLLKNEAMLSAVFLDRRYSVDLSAREIELAKIALSNTWERYRNLHQSLHVEDEPQSTPNENESAANVSDEFAFDMSFYLNAKAGGMSDQNGSDTTDASNAGQSVENDKPTIQPNYSMTKPEFLILLSEFEENFKIIDRKTNILNFWKTQKHNLPEIYAVSVILNGCPPSQSTVERAFSTLGNVFGPLRSNLSDKLLSDIMLIKLNSALLYDFFSHERNILEKQFSNPNFLDDEANDDMLE